MSHTSQSQNLLLIILAHFDAPSLHAKTQNRLKIFLHVSQRIVDIDNEAIAVTCNPLMLVPASYLSHNDAVLYLRMNNLVIDSPYSLAMP